MNSEVDDWFFYIFSEQNSAAEEGDADTHGETHDTNETYSKIVCGYRKVEETILQLPRFRVRIAGEVLVHLRCIERSLSVKNVAMSNKYRH